MMSLIDSKLIDTGFDFARKRKKWILLLAACGISSYTYYRLYNLPSVVRKRRRLLKLVGAAVSVVEAVSDSSEAIGVVSKDLNEFLRSSSDQIPSSVMQISKIARSAEFLESITGVSEALTLGVLRGYDRLSSKDSIGSDGSSDFVDRVLDKILTPSGSGFASVVVGSFARSMVMAFYDQSEGTESDIVPGWVDLLCSDKVKGLIGDCIQLFVSSAITVYLEKTMDINTYDELIAGMTNPKHDVKVKEMLASVCNTAVETLIRTSHDVLTSSNVKENKSSGSPNVSIEDYSKGNYSHGVDTDNDDSGWVTKVSSTLAVPKNRKLVLDLTGRVTFETVRSVMGFALEKVGEGMVRRVSQAQETITDRGREVVRYVTAKSNVITTVCLCLCLHVLESAWILAPTDDVDKWQ